MRQLPPGHFDSDVIHAFSLPLGQQRWLVCAYLKLVGGYVWDFRYGGDLAPSHWPNIIARGLSGLPRFGNHPEQPYSVLRHSYLLARYVREVLKLGPAAVLLALTHDSPECLGAGDMNTFLKRSVGQEVRSYEDDLTDFLTREMNFAASLTEEDQEAVHAADQTFGMSEARLLGMDNGIPWLVPETEPIYLWLRTVGLYDTNPYYSRREWLKLYSVAYYDLLLSIAPGL